MKPGRGYDPKFRSYRVAVYVAFLGVMGFVMVSMLVGVIRYVFFR